MCFRPPDKREDKTNGWPGRGNIHRCIVEFQQPDTGGGAAGDSSKREWTVNREFQTDPCPPAAATFGDLLTDGIDM
jgi:hypothetical protein